MHYGEKREEGVRRRKLKSELTRMVMSRSSSVSREEKRMKRRVCA